MFGKKIVKTNEKEAVGCVIRNMIWSRYHNKLFIVGDSARDRDSSVDVLILHEGQTSHVLKFKDILVYFTCKISSGIVRTNGWTGRHTVQDSAT